MSPGDLPGAAENRRLAVMDIAAVQAHFAKLGRLTRIDLRLADDVAPEAAQVQLQAILPAGVLIEAPQAAENQAANLSRAYRVNPTMLAAMALLTAGFLVFSAQALKAGNEPALLGGHGHPGLGAALLATSLAACWIPPLNGLPVGGYLAIACLLAGGMMLLPATASGIAGLLPQRGPVPTRLAAARLSAAPEHTVVAAAGVLTSVALAVAMAIMVASFRGSVDQWLEQILPADLYLRAGPAQTSGFLDEVMQARIASVPGIDRVSFTRHESLRLAAAQAPVALIARPVSATGRTAHDRCRGP